MAETLSISQSSQCSLGCLCSVHSDSVELPELSSDHLTPVPVVPSHHLLQHSPQTLITYGPILMNKSSFGSLVLA